MIGASAAGVSAAMASRQAGFIGEIVVVGAEPHPPYERPPLSKRLVDVDDVESALSPIVPEDQLRSNDIMLRLGLRVRAIDSSAGTVLLDDGETLAATAGVVVDDGVVVDEHGRTSLPWLFAAGDVASRPHVHCPAPVRIEQTEQRALSGRGGRQGDGRKDGPVCQEGRGRAIRRRTTATSWRSTRSSAFLDACLRTSTASQPMS